MDEKALDDLYSESIRRGYRGSKEEFIQILYSDSAAFDDMFAYATYNGYNGSVDDFSELIGKKKSQQIPEWALTEQAQAAQDLVLRKKQEQQQQQQQQQQLVEEQEVVEKKAAAPAAMASSLVAPSSALPSTDNFAKSLSKLTTDIIDLDEEDAVPKLNDIFREQGFTFEQTGFGDKVEVTAPNKQKKTFSIDMFTKSGDQQVVNDMKAWIQQNKTDFSAKEAELSEQDFEKSLSTIDTDLASQDEDMSIPYLQEMFKGYGFSFKTEGMGDNITVTAPNGAETTIAVDRFGKAANEESAKRLKNFMDMYRPAMPKMTEQYNKYESRIRTEEDLKNVKESFNNEVTYIRGLQREAVIENASLEKEAKALQSVPQSQRGTQEYMDRLASYNERKAALTQNIGMLSQAEKDIQLKSSQLDVSIGRYTAMKAEQGSMGWGIVKKFLGEYGSMTAAMSGISLDLMSAMMPEILAPEADKQLKFLEIAEDKGVEVPKEIRMELLGKKAELEKYEESLKSLPLEERKKKIDEYEKTRLKLYKGSEMFDAWAKANFSEDEIGKINDNVNDFFLKSAKADILPDIRTSLSKYVTGATEEYLQTGGIIKQGVLGLAGSAPAMLSGGPAARVVAFGLQGYDATMREMSSPEFKDVSEGEKYMVALPIAIVSGVLEEYGFRNVIGKSGIVNDIVAKVVGKAGSGASASTFKELVENEVKSRAARGLLTAAGATLAEAETGALQEASAITIKQIYNAVKDKELFQTPQSVTEWFEQVGEAAAAEAVGGFIMGAPSSVSTAISERNYNGITDKDVALFSLMANDANIKEAYALKIKQGITSGQITEEKGKALLESYDKGVSAVNAMPEGLNPAAQRKAIGLLIEKNELQKQVEGKDEAMVKKQKARIAEINSELEKVSEMKEEAAPAEAPSVAPSEAKPKILDEIQNEEVKNFLSQDLDFYGGALEFDKKEYDRAKEEFDSKNPIVRFFGKRPNYEEYTQYSRNKIEQIKNNPEQYLKGQIDKYEEYKKEDGEDFDSQDYLDYLKYLQSKLQEENAIQKQAAGQVPVQPTARLSEEVAQGEPQAEPEGVTEEGKVKEEIPEVEAVETVDVSKGFTDYNPQDLRIGEEVYYSFDGKSYSKGKVVNRPSAAKQNVYTIENENGVPTVIIYGGERTNVTLKKPQAEPQVTAQAGVEEEVSRLEQAFGGEFAPTPSGGVSAQTQAPTPTALSSTTVFDIKNGLNQQQARQAIIDLIDKFGQLGLLDKENVEYYKTRIVRFGEKFGAEFNARDAINQYAKNKNVRLSEEEIGNLAQQIKTAYEVAMGIKPSIAPASSSGVSVSNEAQFMLESQQSQAKQEMIDEATKLMEQEEKNGFSEKAFDATNPEPTVKPISIEIKENTRLADKVKRMGLKELIGKKINLVMADQLKVGDVSIGKKILKRMGGPFFPLIDELFGKVAWASINKSAASSIVNGAIKSDYTVVYNMNPSAIDSNAAIRDTFIAMVRKMPKDERDAIVSKIVNQIKGKKFGPKTEQVQKDILKVKTLSNFEKMMSDLDVDTKAKIINMILPSKDVKAETEIGLTLQGKGITIESIREMNIEQFVADLPAGALTMVIEVQDKNGNKITEATKEEAIITPEQQKEEGLPSHDNYPIYIRGKAVAILSETVPFWNILKDSLNTINVKVAKIVKETSGRAFTAKEARSAEMRSASMTASTARKVSDIVATEYEKFVSLLSRAFPTVEVVANQKEFDKLIDELGAKKLLTKDQNVYGAVYNGKVYLNPSLENYNTPIHEFGHIWLNVVKNVNPELYKKGLSLVSNSPYIQQIKDNKDYQRVIKNMMKEGASESEIDTYIKEEALATAIGDRGESFVIAAQQKNFKEWLNKLYSVVRKLTGISKYTAEQLETITFDEFTKAVAVDLMSGNEIFTKLQVKELSRQLQLSTGKKDSASIVKDARAQGYSEAAIKAFLVKKGFTAQEADALMSKPEAGKKIELGEELMEGYDRMMAEVDGIIEKGLNRRSSQEKIMENVLAYVQGSKAYENATDQQREQIVREVKKAFGEKMKSAPSVGKILGTIKDVKKVTMTEMSLLKKQLTDAAKGAKDLMKVWTKANKKLTAELKDMVRSGSINTKQLVAVLRKFQNTNLLNQDSIDSFIQYMARVFADANYAERISNIRKNLRAAKRNIQTKIGVAESVQPLLQQMLSINPTLIPESVFDKYEALVAMLGQRKAVLELRDIDDVRADATAVMDAVTAEVSKVPDLADRFESYADKVVDEDGKVQYSETVDKMLEDDVIDADEVAIMRKYRSKIMPATPKAKMTEAEIAQEKQDLIAAIKATRIEPSKLALRDEKESASQLSKLIDDDVLEKMDNKQLKTLLAVIGNINNGYMPHQAQIIKEVINAKKKQISRSVVNAKPLPLSRIYNKLKALISKTNNDIYQMIVSNPLFNIDEVLGNFKAKDIFNALFNDVAKASATYDAAMTKIRNRLDEAYTAVSKSFGNDPAKVNRSSYRMMAYMLQLEHQTNPAGIQTKHSAMDYLEKTIAESEKGNTPYTDADIKMFREILNEMNELKDTDGNVDLDAFYSKFNAAEKNAIKVVQEINIETRDKAIYTSSVIRGDRITPLNNYVHHSLFPDNQPDETITNITTSQNVIAGMNPSTRGKSLIARTGVLSAMNFDVFAATQRGANFVMLDYYMTEPIRTAHRTLNETERALEEEYGGKVPKEKREVFNAIRQAFETAKDDYLTNKMVEDSFFAMVGQELARQGYRAMLASVPRFAAELASNMTFAMTSDPLAMATGVGLTSVVMSSDAPSIMINLKSKNTNRVFSNDTLSGRMVDRGILNETTTKGTRGTKNGVINKIQQIHNNSTKKLKNSMELLADVLIATPDKMMIRPIWFGAFANEFERITGKKPDFDKIAANDEAYMSENKEALDEATAVADNKSTMAGATDNAFMGILKGNIKVTDDGYVKFFKMFNSFMSRFLIFEYTTARTAVHAAMGKGYLSKRQGAALLAAVTLRMTLYTFIVGILSQEMINLFTPDEEEEEEKSLQKKAGQAMAQGFNALLLGRNFGNFTKGIINYGVEWMNEKYLDFLREGEYDPYKDRLAYSYIPSEDKKGEKPSILDFFKNMMGPYTPIFNATELAYQKMKEAQKRAAKEAEEAARPKEMFEKGKSIKEVEAEKVVEERKAKEMSIRIPLELLGAIGMIPLYRDVRKIILNDMYKDLKQAKVEAEKAKAQREADKPPMGLTMSEYKRYFPDEYEARYGEGSEYYNRGKVEDAIIDAENAARRRMLDAFFNYVPKQDISKDIGKRPFDINKSNKKSSLGKRPFD